MLLYGSFRAAILLHIPGFQLRRITAYLCFILEAKRHAISLNPIKSKIELLKKRWFIWFRKRQAYEVITIETSYSVLVDLMKRDKIFFAKMSEWNPRVESLFTSVRHIKPDAEKKELE